MLTIKNGNLFENLEPNCVIPHCVNDLGQWGSGFVLAIDKYLGPVPKQDYLDYSRDGIVKLGSARLSKAKDVTVAHMWGQHKTIREHKKPIRYGALSRAMEEVSDIVSKDRKIIAPRFGCGLAGGNKQIIEELIKEIWADFDVTIYEY